MEMTMNKTATLCGRSLISAIALGALLFSAMAEGQTHYGIETKWTIGGEGGWDYLTMDAPAHRLYVTHGPKVEVLDTTTGKVVGQLSGYKSTHGVALDPDGKFGYVSDGAGNAVVVFDRSTLENVATIPAGTNPDGIIFEPKTKTVWAFNGRSKNVTVIDTNTRKVVATIALPGKPEFPQTDGTGIIYDNIEDTNSIVRLDASTLKMTAQWPMAGCESPSGMAIDLKGHKLFSVCDGKKMAVTDYATGKVLGLAEVGDGPDAAAFDGKTGLAFSSNGEGTLTVVDAGKKGFPAVQTLKTFSGARTMAFDEGTGRVYLAAALLGPKPAPSAANPRGRAQAIPGSFMVVVIGAQAGK
jgi:YVTN family beta-propeller protein